MIGYDRLLELQNAVPVSCILKAETKLISPSSALTFAWLRLSHF